MGAPEVQAFLTHLAVERKFSSSTQTQVLSALLFLYRHVLHLQLDELQILRAKKVGRVPVVLSRAETPKILSEMSGTQKLMTQILGSLGIGVVWLPNAFEVKYPNAHREWGWQFVFPSSKLADDLEAKTKRRWHTSESTLQKAIRAASQKSGIAKRIGPHTFRHCFATHY